MKRLPSSLAILHVVDSLEFGGLERVVTDLALAQQEAGHRVAVFSINATTGFSDELRKAGIEVVIGQKAGTLDFKVIRLPHGSVRTSFMRTTSCRTTMPRSPC
jgi:hypothetical protein